MCVSLNPQSSSGRHGVSARWVVARVSNLDPPGVPTTDSWRNVLGPEMNGRRSDLAIWRPVPMLLIGTRSCREGLGSMVFQISSQRRISTILETKGSSTPASPQVHPPRRRIMHPPKFPMGGRKKLRNTPTRSTLFQTIGCQPMLLPKVRIHFSKLNLFYISRRAVNYRLSFVSPEAFWAKLSPLTFLEEGNSSLPPSRNTRCSISFLLLLFFVRFFYRLILVLKKANITLSC